MRDIRQSHTGLARLGLQFDKVGGVQLYGADGQALFKPDMVKVALDKRVDFFNGRAQDAWHGGH